MVKEVKEGREEEKKTETRNKRMKEDRMTWTSIVEKEQEERRRRRLLWGLGTYVQTLYIIFIFLLFVLDSDASHRYNVTDVVAMGDVSTWWCFFSFFLLRRNPFKPRLCKRRQDNEIVLMHRPHHQ